MGDLSGGGMAQARPNQNREGLKKLGEWQKRRRAKALESVRRLRSNARERVLESKREAPSSSMRQQEMEPVDDHGSDGTGVGAAPVPMAGGEVSAHELGRGGSGFEKGKHVRRSYARQLSVMEWLVDVPEDLHTNWYVMPRPEGPRCLLISEGGSTESRLKDGSFHKRFQSPLPGGSKGCQGGKRASKCVLDAVFHAPTNTFFVTDCMIWDSYDMHECDFEFRRFWLVQKMAELRQCQSQCGDTYATHNLDVVPAEMASIHSMERAYREDVGYVKDGFVFVHKESHYRQGQTPLCLQWKDANTSRYPIDTDAHGNVLEKQPVVLQLSDDSQSVRTGDEPPITLGRMPQHFADTNAKQLKPGMLFRFNIGENCLHFGSDGQPVGADLELVGVSRKRLEPDIVSKIIFKYLFRMQHITFQMLLKQ